MPVRELAQLTWQEVGGVDRERGVAVLPIGALEAHGPHLPLGTDVIIAEAMARAGADRLAVRGMDVLLLPTLAYTAAPFAADFPGTLSLDPTAVTAAITGVARESGAPRPRRGWRSPTRTSIPCTSRRSARRWSRRARPGECGSCSLTSRNVPGRTGSPRSSRVAPAMRVATRHPSSWQPVPS